MVEHRFKSKEYNIRIDKWLSKMLTKHSRSYIQKLIENENVSVNNRKVRANYKLKINDEVIVYIPEPERLDVKEEDIKLEIIYEDNDLIVINKPKGMVVHPAAGHYTGTLVNALMYYCGDRLSDINGIIRPGIVHRIDKDTSGTLIIAKNNNAHEIISKKLKKHDIKRVYIAIVNGVIDEETGKIDAPIGRHPVDRKKMAVNTRNGKKAITHFKVLERFKDTTYIQLELETGRTHQIRVHMAYIGYTLIGDRVYGTKTQKYGVEGQALHAKSISFCHPATNKFMEFEAQTPQYFIDLLKELKGADERAKTARP